MKPIFEHPIIKSNPFTEWFARGEADEEQVADLLMQFSVFSNHFLVVQVKRMVNAGTLEGEACARNILLNECGVALDAQGCAEGRRFSAANAHISWLRESGAALGLDPAQMGRWENGWESTRRFLDGLDRSFGSRDGNVGAGASFAVESWASFGIGAGPELESRNFWKQLIAGLEKFNAGRHRPVPMGFFKFHFEVEAGHGANVQKELEEIRLKPGFDERKFLRGAKLALDSVKLFWEGLDQARRRPAALAGVNVAQWAL